eukprot:353829-Pelagomonas_calceolata.AAC.1
MPLETCRVYPHLRSAPSYLRFSLVVASICAGSRVWRIPSSSWRTPCAESCSDCAKHSSAKGYVSYEWDMVAQRAQFMGGARRACVRNFRGKYDIVYTAEGVSNVVITVFASSLVVKAMYSCLRIFFWVLHSHLA